ncbi:HNH endonuclease signature motif containing protein [Gottfriedia sp. NPDC056225]|uniref:HNH endonuclease signature motif containing protein n=1 Tax=Gottfriedia sp. NPDC056225 TaxID=3345751 RepID=UPI0035E2CA33
MNSKCKKKLAEKEIQQVQELYSTGEWIQKGLAERFGVNEFQISKAVEGVIKPKLATLQRFNKKWTEDDNGCHVWNACTDKDGYGLFKMEGKSMRANRVSYRLHKGEIPKGQTVRHTCDNEVCVNPDHLILGTQIQNNQDKIERFRQPWQFESIEYLEMRFLYQIGVTEDVIVERFGIKKETLRNRLLDMEMITEDPTEDKIFFYRNRAMFEEKQSKQEPYNLCRSNGDRIV